jgi:putative hydrolase of the HAD superfamily
LYWDTFVAEIKLFDGVFDWLQEVKKRNIKIVMVTDLTADVQFLKIEKLHLDEVFDWIVTSEEAGCEKPHPYIFQLALQKSGLSADRVWMIGDSYEKDIRGALNLGIKPFWLNRSEKVKEVEQNVSVIKEFNEMWGYINERN